MAKEKGFAFGGNSFVEVLETGYVTIVVVLQGNADKHI